MKKAITLKVISSLMFTAAAVAVICTIYVRDVGGFIDMTNLARGFFVGAAVIFALVAVIFHKLSVKYKE